MSKETGIRAQRDKKGNWSLEGWGEEGTLMAGMIILYLVAIFSVGFLLSPPGWAIVTQAIVQYIAVTAMVIYRLRQIHERKMREMDA